MSRTFFIAICILSLTSCTTIKESSVSYFRSHKALAGVESVEQVLQRAEQEKRMRSFIYEHLTPARILQCTVLRNQLYVAAKNGLSGSEGKEIAAAATTMETAYQESDENFLFACDQVLQSTVGQVFWRTAQYYLGKDQR